MRIAIALNGDGMGHATRIMALAKKLPYTLVFFCPDHIHNLFKRHFPKTKIYPVPHTHIIKSGNKVKILKTAIENKGIVIDRKTPKLISDIMKKERIDALICDYEPYSSKAAKIAKVPTVWFGHQAILETEPARGINGILAKLTNKLMMPHYDKRISSSFYNGDVGPLIREEIIKAKRSKEDHIIVYAKETAREHIKNAISCIEENFQFFPDDNKNYVKALASCKAVISTAGHQLISECLYLEKPILLIPEKGQYEQELNAKMAEGTGWAKASSLQNLRSDIVNFLKTLNCYPKKTSIKIRVKTSDSTKEAVCKIEEFIKNSYQE
ncbi:hypothetical protein D6825_03780 [Candidatus Woesearchaeota archaeon]|nr:MAG: hypothetical protein D6825_03780 [Candidatus Woesearchaeota archaeon]